MTKRNLSADAFEEASYFVLHSARALERNAYRYYFEDAGSDELLFHLGNYRNKDGGYGYGLEPDMRLPSSSPVATARAFRVLDNIEEGDNYRKMVETGIGYFESTYLNDKNRWFSTPEEVNDYPHAPWWHFGENGEGTMVDKDWGNPTAEITAYLVKYRDFVRELEPDELLERAIEKLNSKREFESKHEVLCYLRLYEVLPAGQSRKMEDSLDRAVRQLVCEEPSEWSGFVPRPLDFVNGPESPRFGMSDRLIEENLRFLISSLEEDGVINPSWEWGQYEAEWKRAKKEWTGILTLKALIVLDKFARIED